MPGQQLLEVLPTRIETPGKRPDQSWSKSRSQDAIQENSTGNSGSTHESRYHVQASSSQRTGVCTIYKQRRKEEHCEQVKVVCASNKDHGQRERSCQQETQATNKHAGSLVTAIQPIGKIAAEENPRYARHTQTQTSEQTGLPGTQAKGIFLMQQRGNEGRQRCQGKGFQNPHCYQDYERFDA